MSCTQAGFLVLKHWRIGHGDEVIVPAMTFLASATMVLHTGAKPVFVDVDPLTGLIDPAAVEAAITARTRAIVAVHLYGQLADMRALRAIADRHDIFLLEDSAHCIEGIRDGVRPAQLGDAACFSFYATKNITCGEGGAIASNDPALVDSTRLLRLHGMDKSAADRYTNLYKHWDMVTLGFKANMTDLQASMLLGQLGRIGTLLERREEIAGIYEQAFCDRGVGFPTMVGERSARHLFTIWAEAGQRDRVLRDLQEDGIGVAVHYRAVPTLTYFVETFGFVPGQFPVAESMGDRTISIPLYPRLTEEQIDHVIASVERSWRAPTHS
jgi:UDP-4-amino-4-deoxy-L-arabinose-oxoglutarate aminotransferase